MSCSLKNSITHLLTNHNIKKSADSMLNCCIAHELSLRKLRKGLTVINVLPRGSDYGRLHFIKCTCIRYGKYDSTMLWKVACVACRAGVMNWRQRRKPGPTSVTGDTACSTSKFLS